MELEAFLRNFILVIFSSHLLITKAFPISTRAGESDISRRTNEFIPPTYTTIPIYTPYSRPVGNSTIKNDTMYSIKPNTSEISGQLHNVKDHSTHPMKMQNIGVGLVSESSSTPAGPIEKVRIRRHRKGKGKKRRKGNKVKKKKKKKKMNLRNLKRKLARAGKSIMDKNVSRGKKGTGEKRRAILYSAFGLLCLFV